MNTSFDLTLMLLFVIALVPITGVIVAITPFLMKKSEVFAVTVPETAEQDPFLKRLKRHYVLYILLITLIISGLLIVFLITGAEEALVVGMTSGLFVICGCSYALMLFYRKKVNAYKDERNWQATRQEMVAIIGEQAIPEAISLKWHLLVIPLCTLTALIGWIGYDSIPDQIPLQIGLDGAVTSWMSKSVWVIVFPVFIQLFLALCFLLTHWIILRSKRPVNPSAPMVSAYAYGLFARTQSLFLVTSGLLLCVTMIAMPFTFTGALTLAQAAALILAAAFIIIIAALVISVVYGQAGSRIFKRLQASSSMLADDDSHWKLGIIYYNRNDPNLFLPARFGIGWTCNFARPAIWLLISGFIVTCILFVGVLLALQR